MKLQIPALSAQTWIIMTVGAGVGLYVLKNGIAGAAAGVVRGVGEAASGAIVGIGETVGIPATNMSECDKARAEGRTWDASFVCPAGTFIGWVFGGDGPRSGGATGEW